MSQPATTPAVRIPEGSLEVPMQAQLGLQSSIAAPDMLSLPYDSGDDPEPPEQEPKCFLLDISGELRNRIYREVLVLPESVHVASTGYEHPALLHTCKQVRQEATSIFFQENVFAFAIDRFDSTPLIRFRNRAPSMALIGGPFQQGPWLRDQSPNWQNLEEWLNQFYHCNCIGSPTPEYMLKIGAEVMGRLTLYYIIGGMFEIVKQARVAGISWSIAKKMFEGHRPILIALDKAWAMEAR